MMKESERMEKIQDKRQEGTRERRQEGTRERRQEGTRDGEQQKRGHLGRKIDGMLLLLSQAYILSAAVFVGAIGRVEDSARKMGNLYLNVEKEYGYAGKHMETAQKYANILSASTDADLAVAGDISGLTYSEVENSRACLEKLEKLCVEEPKLNEKYQPYQKAAKALLDAIEDCAQAREKDGMEGAKAVLSGPMLELIWGQEEVCLNFEEKLSAGVSESQAAVTRAVDAAYKMAAGVFAVVADEIRILAENSRETANAIQNINTVVTGTVNALAAHAEEMMEFLNSQIAGDYKNFVQMSLQYHEDADSMNERLIQFSQNAGQMKETISSIWESLQSVQSAMEESASGIQMSSADMTELVNTIDVIAKQSEENRKVSKHLKRECDIFVKI